MLMYAIGKGITDQITKENFEAVEATQKRRPPPAAWCMHVVVPGAAGEGDARAEQGIRNEH